MNIRSSLIILLLVFTGISLASYISAQGPSYPNPGHPASEIGPGTFNCSGANCLWKFPGKVIIEGILNLTGYNIVNVSEVKVNKIDANEIKANKVNASEIYIDGYNVSDLLLIESNETISYSYSTSAYIYYGDQDLDGVFDFKIPVIEEGKYDISKKIPVDCDPSNSLIGLASDGTCDGDGDGLIDCTTIKNGCTTAKVPQNIDCNDNSGFTIYSNVVITNPPADGTCDGDNDGWIDKTTVSSNWAGFLYLSDKIDYDDNDSHIQLPTASENAQIEGIMKYDLNNDGKLTCGGIGPFFMPDEENPKCVEGCKNTWSDARFCLDPESDSPNEGCPPVGEPVYVRYCE